MKPLSICLTGGIASGKSAASDYLHFLGIPIIDADIIAKQLVEPEQPALKIIIETFGHQYLFNERLDRKKLRTLIFSNPQAKQQLEAILHPLIRQTMQQQAALLNNIPYILQVIPLLSETHQADQFEHILVILSDTNTQLNRLCLRDGLSLNAANNILKQQATNDQRKAIATYCIENNGSLQELHQQLHKFHQYILTHKVGL